MNRAPAPRDPWWAEHQRKCGGNFIKIKEPEKVDKKKKMNKGIDIGPSTPTSKTNSTNNKNANSNDKNSAITNWFPKTSSFSTSSSTKTIKGPENSKKPNKFTTGSGGSKMKAGSSTSTVVTSKTNQKNNEENDIFRSSSENSSSNIYGFKMSANNKATSQTRDKPASFSGSGQCLGTVATGNKSANGREAFLKKLESNKKSATTSLKNHVKNSFPASSSSNGKLSSNRKPFNKDNSISEPISEPISRLSETQSSVSGKSRLFGAKTESSRQNSSSSSVETKKRKLEETNSENCENSKNRNLSTHDVINIPDDVEMMEVDGNLIECPACPQKVPAHLLNEHLDKCLS